MKISEPVSKAVPTEALLPSALEVTLTALGDGPKAAVLATLQQKYGLPVKGPLLNPDKVSDSFLDLFGEEGGQMLLEKLWRNLEEVSGQKKVPLPSSKSRSRKKTVQDKAISTEEFNSEVSRVFSDFILETLGPDSYSWLEIRLREQDTSLKRCYYDADKISPVLWSSFNGASDFVLNKMMSRLCGKLGVKPVRYSIDSKLSAILSGIFDQVSPAKKSLRVSAA